MELKLYLNYVGKDLKKMKKVLFMHLMVGLQENLNQFIVYVKQNYLRLDLRNLFCLRLDCLRLDRLPPERTGGVGPIKALPA